MKRAAVGSSQSQMTIQKMILACERVLCWVMSKEMACGIRGKHKSELTKTNSDQPSQGSLNVARRRMHA